MILRKRLRKSKKKDVYNRTSESDNLDSDPAKNIAQKSLLKQAWPIEEGCALPFKGLFAAIKPNTDRARMSVAGIE